MKTLQFINNNLWATAIFHTNCVGTSKSVLKNKGIGESYGI